MIGQVADVLLGLFSLDGVTDGPREEAGSALSLDEVVLRAALHGRDGEALVPKAAQHDDRHVRKIQIKEDSVELGLFEPFQGIAQPRHTYEIEQHRPRLGQHLPDETRVSRVTLDEQDTGLVGALLSEVTRSPNLLDGEVTRNRPG